MCFDSTHLPFDQVSPSGAPGSWCTRKKIHANSSIFQWQEWRGQWMAICRIWTGTSHDIPTWSLLAQDINSFVPHFTECLATWDFLEERRSPSLFAIWRDRHSSRPRTEKPTGWLTDRRDSSRHRWGPWFLVGSRGLFLVWADWWPLLKAHNVNFINCLLHTWFGFPNNDTVCDVGDCNVQNRISSTLWRIWSGFGCWNSWFFRMSMFGALLNHTNPFGW